MIMCLKSKNFSRLSFLFLRFPDWLHSPFEKGGSGHLRISEWLQGGFRNPFLIQKLFFTFKKMYYLPYNKNLKDFSRQLRNHSTLGEILLWQKLRAGSMMKYTFNRQKPLDRYIVDFYCKPLNLVIEVDGAYHFEAAQIIKDKERQQILEEMGLHFLRFHDEEIRKDIDVVLRKIENCIVAYEAEHPEVKGGRKTKPA